MPPSRNKPNVDLFVNGRLKNVPIHMKYKETEMHFFMDFHSHEGYEIYYFHEGEGCFLIEDKIYPLQGGDLVFVGPHESHKCSPELGIANTRTVIHFLPELVDPVSRDWLLEIFHRNPEKRHTRLESSHSERFSQVTGRIYQECSERPNDYLYGVRAYLNELLFELHRFVFDEARPNTAQTAKRSVNPKIELAVQYLSTHFQESLTLEKLAKELFINEYYLSHLFKTTVGISITEFILQTRIHHAKRFLLHTEMSVTEISESVGFNNSSYFGQAFKTKTGLSPRDFRKEYKYAPPSL